MSASTKNKGKKPISVLHDNPPLPGKKYFLVSMISPDSRQKHSVHGFKIHDMCETEEEGRYLGEYYRNLDPDFDVALGVVGKWIPWLWDPLDVPNIEYANERLTDLIKSHRMNKQTSDLQWKKQVDEHLEKIDYAYTKEGQEELLNKKEPAVSLLFKIRQIEYLIERRNQELENLKEVYYEKYTEDERVVAEKAELPITEPVPMQYTLLSSAGDDEEEKGKGRPLKIEEELSLEK